MRSKAGDSTIASYEIAIGPLAAHLLCYHGENLYKALPQLRPDSISLEQWLCRSQKYGAWSEKLFILLCLTLLGLRPPVPIGKYDAGAIKFSWKVLWSTFWAEINQKGISINTSVQRPFFPAGLRSIVVSFDRERIPFDRDGTVALWVVGIRIISCNLGVCGGCIRWYRGTKE